jgi:Tfp pilus assembly protein PilP
MKSLLLTFILATATAASAQTPVSALTQPPGAESAPTPPSNYKYAPDGRRDPFASLVNRGTDGKQKMGVRPEGLTGILVEEVVVHGIVQSRGGYVAMIKAPSGRSYSIRAGDRLMDGAVKTITQQTVVLMQEVNDPLSLAKQREVRKGLRGEVK